MCSNKKIKINGALVYAVALLPAKLCHLGDDVADLLLQGLRICICRQGAKNVREVDSRVAVHDLRQHPLQSSRAEPARLLGQLRGDAVPETCKSRSDPSEEEAELGTVREIRVRRVDEVFDLQRQQLLVNVGRRRNQVFGPYLNGLAEELGCLVDAVHQSPLLAELLLQLVLLSPGSVERFLQSGDLQFQVLDGVLGGLQLVAPLGETHLKLGVCVSILLALQDERGNLF